MNTKLVPVDEIMGDLFFLNFFYFQDFQSFQFYHIPLF
ncbi:hypothetical protein LEP1GSC045_2069 [Leptospira interrogans serovar Pomona str. Kennewicki LC82-25]|nr:hypothetical protein LEP1GSC045_2069 [Leptospira interrogans serovar Pomona str. Kennewicki LC82-25]EKN95294.1 hypothetical protein LEP1GSC014_0294 [Leptospira interrogans serovar Pomona str. Pomona]EKR84332.1 hypothetical protein LEP1GSC099_4733 [Leptospira interrogans str. UI 08452]EMF33434.1 hypothetical protein LEP1GSC201_1066 [Leptospira interrogans serovar Pomona str. Fox 32256]EMI69436.1 hypothetical protein LEP1GSC200_1866 [Leptospira interrogans serovar Pomona str. CSL10083]EMJ6010